MLKNYFKFAVRNLSRSKTLSVVNVIGLTVSLTAFILMALYIEYEFSYDKFHRLADRIYRVVDDKQTNALRQHGAGSAAPVGPAIQSEFPEIGSYARILKSESLVKCGSRLFQEKNIWFADPAFLQIFDFPLLKGNAATALKEPLSVVLTISSARKYFGDTDPIGKIMLLNNKAMKVTGITADVPGNSHLNYDLLVSMTTAESPGSGFDWLFENWYSNDFYTYILLPKNYDSGELAARFPAFAARHQKANSATQHHYSLEKLTDIYLHSDRDNQAGETGNMQTLYIFLVIAVFILLIACINFVNLSTARSAARAKEVGIKKVNGVTRNQLLVQFFAESFLITLLAVTFAVLSAYGLLPVFNAFAGKSIPLAVFTPVHIATLAAVIIVTGTLAGAYPAVVLSSFNPVKALKGEVRSGAWAIFIRKGLVVIQFVISIVLIVSSIVVYKQLAFMQRHDLGFKPAQTLVINFEGNKDVKKQYVFIKNELLRVPGVKNVSASSNVPGDLNSGGWSMEFAMPTGDTIHAEFPVYSVDFNFLNQFNIPVIAGREFSERYSADTATSMMINETALKRLGITDPQRAIGLTVGMYPNAAKITGVFRDFHFESLQKAIQPMAMRVLPAQFSLLSLQLQTTDMPQTMAAVAQVWKRDASECPFEYTFLDESFNKQYQADIKFGQLFGIFTGLAITIASLGLFGLTLFSVKQRTREIGMRKVLGASVTQIAVLLSREFINLVIMAIFVAMPISLYFMGRWISSFAYRIELNWWIFAAGGAIAILIAIATVSYQAVKAGVANPVRSLRSE